MKPAGRIALKFDTAVDDGEKADTCVCGWERLFCFVLYLISRHEFSSSHPDHFAMNGNLP
jgi:hypothetical protein